MNGRSSTCKSLLCPMNVVGASKSSLNILKTAGERLKLVPKGILQSEI